jgi:hypothetical protein
MKKISALVFVAAMSLTAAAYAQTPADVRNGRVAPVQPAATSVQKDMRAESPKAAMNHAESKAKHTGKHAHHHHAKKEAAAAKTDAATSTTTSTTTTTTKK